MSDPDTGPTSSSPSWASRASSAADAESLDALAGVDPATLGGPELVDAIVASEKALSLLAGTQMRLLAALARPFVAGDPMRLAARLARKNCMIGDDSDEMVQLLVPDAAISLASAEVAAALRISPVTAGIRVREAGTMTTVLSRTLNALEDGTLDRGKARIIAEHCDPLSPDDKAAVQELVLPLAGAATNSELRDLTGQAVITVDPDGCDERHRAAAARRELAIKALPDAMATLKAFLPADGAVKIFQLTDLLATATAGAHGDQRGIGARRVDALVDIADQLLTLGHLDLSHYLGNPLPDHGNPRAQESADDRPDGEEGSDPSGTQAEAGSHPGSESGSHSSHARVGVANGTGSSTAAESNAAGSNAGSNAADLAGPSHTNEGDARHPSSTAPVDTGFDCPAPSSASHTDGGPIAEPITDASPTQAARRNRRAGSAQRAASASSEKPCESCGSIGRGDRSLTRQGRRPHLSVTLGLGTLAGLDSLPGKLAGFGAIPPGLARSIAKSAATITTLLTDPETGTITDAGALVYRPRQALRDQIAALLATCQFPSCRQPVWRCDIDHREPFDHQNPEQGGHTTRENTGPYCRRHHLFKHHTEWQTRPDPSLSTMIWISPTGHRYVKGRSQATPPDIWVTTAGTKLAERLDNMTATADVLDGSGVAGSVPEELLTAILLRHELNRPPAEYDPAVRDAAVRDNSIRDNSVRDCALRDNDYNGSSTNGSATNDTATNDTATNDTATNDRGDDTHSENESSNDAAPNARSWPAIDDPPPF